MNEKGQGAGAGINSGLGNVNASRGSFEKEFDPRTLTRSEADMRKDMNASRMEKSMLIKKDSKYRESSASAQKPVMDRKMPLKPGGASLELDNINPSLFSAHIIILHVF